MQTEGPHEGSPGAAEGPPSARSRDALTDDLRRELADAGLRLEEAGLRAEAHRLLGNHRQAVEATEEQQAILAEVESRLARVVSTAVVQRDAEHVLARATPAPVTAATEPLPPVGARPRVPMLSGIASVLALAAVATAAILGVSRGLAPVDVVGAAADTPTQDQTEPTSSPDDASAGPATAVMGPTGDRGDRPASEAVPSDPLAPSADPATSSSSEPAEADTPTEDPTDAEDSELGQAVTDLLDAVGRLGGDAGPDAPTPSDDALSGSEADVSGPDPERLLEEEAPDGEDATDDGFVPAPSAQ